MSTNANLTADEWECILYCVSKEVNKRKLQKLNEYSWHKWLKLLAKVKTHYEMVVLDEQ